HHSLRRPVAAPTWFCRLRHCPSSSRAPSSFSRANSTAKRLESGHLLLFDDLFTLEVDPDDHAIADVVAMLAKAQDRECDLLLTRGGIPSEGALEPGVGACRPHPADPPSDPEAGSLGPFLDRARPRQSVARPLERMHSRTNRVSRRNTLLLLRVVGPRAG